jgi:NAD(P)-dependent dehydrogenase (short-subunit alcohol dehydrogenase family)
VAAGHLGVHALEDDARRDVVDDDQAVDRLGVVLGEAGGDAGAAVVADDGNLVPAEVPHQFIDVAGHGPLVVAGRRPGRFAVAAQVRRDDVEPPGEDGDLVPPAEPGFGEAVQQEDRRPRAGQPRPGYQAPRYRPAGKLQGKVALITGGDSGIGRAVAVLYAREGADVAIVFLPAEQRDADETRAAVEAEGRRCLLLPGDLCDPGFCKQVVERTVRELGKLDILVSNAAHQNRKESLEQITDEEWDRTFQTNVYAYFRLARAALPHLKAGSAIIATSSINGLVGNASLPDYSATKGAINAFTKSLAQSLVKKGIRANVVAPGPVWTPLNTADEGQKPEKVAEFGKQSPLERPAQPEEMAPLYVFLASDADSSYLTGEVIAELGGKTTAG